MILNKSQCIDNCKNDDIYQYEYNNICYKVCPEETIKNETDYMCYANKKIETDFISISELKENEFNKSNNTSKDEREKKMDNFRGMVNDFNVSEKVEDIIEVKDNVQFQMTTSDNQKNNTNKNISTIDLGDCESKLKLIYGIDFFAFNHF